MIVGKFEDMLFVVPEDHSGSVHECLHFLVPVDSLPTCRYWASRAVKDLRDSNPDHYGWTSVVDLLQEKFHFVYMSADVSNQRW